MTPPHGRLRIAVVGGVPAFLGGGGLEVQRRETARALVARGHEVFGVEETGARVFDVLHAFGAEPDVCHWIGHWRRNPAPLVVSPVLVVPAGRERRERLLSRVPLASWGPAQRGALLRRADAVVAQTDSEARMVRSMGAGHVVSVPNGTTRVAPGPAPAGTPDGPYVVLVGTVGARKRQGEVVGALEGRVPVVAGGFEGSADDRASFGCRVAGAGGVYLGEVDDPGSLTTLVAGATALVHLSRAEGQSLAVLEALTVGTPVVVSRLPSMEELARAYPGHVHLVDDAAELPAVLDRLPADRPGPAPVPTWDDVASRLEALYGALVTG